MAYLQRTAEETKKYTFSRYKLDARCLAGERSAQPNSHNHSDAGKQWQLKKPIPPQREDWLRGLLRMLYKLVLYSLSPRISFERSSEDFLISSTFPGYAIERFERYPGLLSHNGL